jgi:hypothetical protein
MYLTSVRNVLLVDTRTACVGALKFSVYIILNSASGWVGVEAKIQARAELALGPRRPCLRAGARRYPACREPQTLLVGLLVDP